MSFAAAFKDHKLRDKIFANALILLCVEIFFGLVFFEWRYSMNIKLNCFISAGVIAIFSIIFLALGIGNKSKTWLAHGFEGIGVSLFTFLAYYVLAIWQAPFKIKGISIYVAIPFVVTAIYYIVKIIRLERSKK